MERIIRILSKEYGNLNQAAILLGFFALLSQILGLFRDRAIAHFIGPGLELDTYYAAFRIPDFIFISIASLFSVTVLIPFLLEKMRAGVVTQEARNFLNSIFIFFFFIIVIFSALVFWLAPFIVAKITPGFDSNTQEQVVELSRIMLLSPILLGLSNIFGSVTQVFKKFFLYALSPIFYNLGIICGIFLLYPKFGILGLAWGVVLGAFLHFVIQFFTSMHTGFGVGFVRGFSSQGIKRVVMQSVPRTLGLALNNIALIMIISVASLATPGSISVFNMSLNLQSVPLGIIGLSYAVAAFPSLSKRFASSDMIGFKRELTNAARNIIFWSVPVMFLFIVLRAQIVRTILGSGVFSWEDTRLVAASLAMFSISVVAQGLIALFARTYYAVSNTRRPLYINMLSSLFIVATSIVLMQYFQTSIIFRFFIEHLFKVSDLPGTEVLMLPLAYSLGTILNFLLLWFFIKKDFTQNEPFILRTFFEVLGASFFIGAVAYLALNFWANIFNLNTFWGVFLQGFLAGISGVVAGAVVLYLLKNNEFRALLVTLRTKFWKTTVVVPSQDEEL